MPNTWSKYKKYRKELLEESPYCSLCGIEHGSDIGYEVILQYHHTTPQHLGTSNHDGVLLCQRCHNLESSRQRNEHKQVSIIGLKHSDNYVYRSGKKQKIRQSKHVEELINAWR